MIGLRNERQMRKKKRQKKEVYGWSVTPNQGTVALNDASQTVRERQQKCTTEESNAHQE